MNMTQEIIFELRFRDAQKKLRKYGFTELAKAKERAIEASLKNELSELAEFIVNDDGETLRGRWAFEKGVEVPVTENKENTEKVTKQQEEEEFDMADPKKKIATPEKKPKDPKPAKTAKTPKAKMEKTPKLTVGAPGSLLAKFGLRAGTNREKAVAFLVENKGKMLPIKELLKATYGSANEANLGALGMVLKGARYMIEANDIAWHLVRTKDGMIGLKEGAEVKEVK